ncbi:MAG TPA: aminotransferase class III-fold pyridoxal phosphate-dependent enzyme [Gemmatimonadaceae bacterium]|nr:aminotransferase class III-fold pyridoxal phosphate-dependent enzyme [Gemmatimonadaceae bacterium]
MSAADAERIAREHFGADGRRVTATGLPSERDQNFLISVDDRPALVLKIANALEQPDMLDAQWSALARLAERGAPTPRVVRSAGGPKGTTFRDNGTSHTVWAVSMLPGKPLSSIASRPAALLRHVGSVTAQIGRALESFDHPAAHRDFYWDLRNARELVGRQLDLVGDDTLRSLIRTLCERYDAATRPHLANLPLAVIHGDLNDNNVLVDRDESSLEALVSGVVDLGDMVHSYRIADLAIAIAYAILGSADPLTGASEIVRGYAAEHVPTDAELTALHGLVCMRLCASVVIAEAQQRERPDNAYLGISQAAIREMLPRLAAIPFRLAEAVYRDAAGVDPLPATSRIVEYLRRTSCAPVLGFDMRSEPTIVLDLGIASPMLSGDARENAEPVLTRKIFGLMADADVRVSIGQYDEPRLLYVAPEFAIGPRPTDEHRTIHIGLDLFAVAGTPVYAPLDGAVHAFHDNATMLDYGPVIILRHATDDGAQFFTLYGHLSRESLAGLETGRRVAAGDQIATIGTPDVNVGWTPHLHLQIIVDLLDLGSDFPGVARPTQRRVWTALSPDPNLIVKAPMELFPAGTPGKEETLAARRARIGGNLSIAYRDPVRIVRGWMQYLYDDEGRCFIDAYNNVPHVGHCHPRVVEAGATQMRVLNTNTRYLNDLLAEYAERVLATLPPGYDVCYFVNSASEANELALRLARAYTGQRDTIVLDAAYHGNTTSLIDISPYKHAGPGGQGAPDWVHVAPLPDVYRGPHKARDPQAGAKYAAQVGEIVDAIIRRARRPAAFIAETCPSVGGQLVLPPGYLSNVYEYVRAAGGVCIADEVQTGLGRMGTSFWAFEEQAVVPDIVVMGKPLGNGHPIGAVATKRRIAEAFDNGMEYFSTFGGNTVSCAIGIAVLDVLRDEGLQTHARRVGDYLLARLRPLAERFPLVGDVRGSGLFLGVELVRDRETLEPAVAEASFVANRMRESGVLLGTDGPHHNVVKIRPPMPFDETNADILIDAFIPALEALAR